jgi:M6 family metalloprotease-like protein
MILLSLYNYSVNEGQKNIPVIVIMSTTENDYLEDYRKDLEKTIFQVVADFYKSTSKGKINLYYPLDESLIVVNIDEEYNYKNRKAFGLKTISESNEYIDYSVFDLNNNSIIEKNELIIMHIIETEDTYEQPIASTIKTEEFYIKNLKIESFIQLGIKEIFSKRESLLTPSTVAHEIGHHFGLPDLYDTDYSSEGLGPMSLMSEIHSDLPINFDPWSKIYLEFEKPLIISKEGIHKIEKEKIYLVETNKNWIYYLIEQRSFKGNDESLKEIMSTDGIFIYRINEKVINETLHLNQVNRDENNMGVKFLGNEVINEEKGIYLKATDSSHLFIEKKKNN